MKGWILEELLLPPSIAEDVYFICCYKKQTAKMPSHVTHDEPMSLWFNHTRFIHRLAFTESRWVGVCFLAEDLSKKRTNPVICITWEPAVPWEATKHSITLDVDFSVQGRGFALAASGASQAPDAGRSQQMWSASPSDFKHSQG